MLSLLEIGLSFISRTGKTHDFRKIKGWQEKFHNASAQEGKCSVLHTLAVWCGRKGEILQTEND